jgi:hypothetical protein
MVVPVQNANSIKFIIILLTNAKIVLMAAFSIFKLILAKNVHQVTQLYKITNVEHAQKILFLIQLVESAKSVALDKLI